MAEQPHDRETSRPASDNRGRETGGARGVPAGDKNRGRETGGARGVPAGDRISRSDGERTRERVLEVALPLFAEHGFAGTSIRRVAQAASVNVATLAYHFTDKQGLYDTVVQRLHEDLEAHWPDASLPSDGSDPIEWLVETAWTFARTHQIHIRLLVRHVLDGGVLPEVVAGRWTGPLMSRADQLVALFRPEWNSVDRRMLVLTVMHLVVRLVLEDRAQLTSMLGATEDPAFDLDRAIRGWLVQMLRRELGVPRTG